MSYLIDTDVLIDGIKGDPVALEWIDANAVDGLSISIISAAEMYHGAYRSADISRHLGSVKQFLGDFSIVALDLEEVEIFARTKVFLQSQGLVVADFDLLIAATALRHNLTLVTRNARHFRRIPGLVIETPA